MSEALHKGRAEIAARMLIGRGGAEHAACARIGWGGGPSSGPRIARVANRHARPQHIATAFAPAPVGTLDDAGGRKAAFTLRLDAQRHARLRDACAASQRSAQQLVTQALDHFLAAVSGPQLETSAAGAIIRTGGI
ncbi:MAG: hypothetical protein JOY99_11115 [Sphingomonadaceae bacterium]|nr:hypothetical protein [Sphingomonadaceae bacterium]